MKLKEIEYNKFYYIFFQFSNENFFEGIVKTTENHKNLTNEDVYIFCKIIKIYKSSNYKIGNEFYIKPENFIKNVSEKDDPEYFI